MKKAICLMLAILFCFLSVACTVDDSDSSATSATTSAIDATSDITSSTTALTTAATTTGATTAPTDDIIEPQPLKAGFSEKDFTPTEMGGPMPGASYPTTAKKVETSLLASAAAFDANGNSLILVSMDILFFLDSHAEEMRERINAQTGVPKENILIAATHTHTSVGLDYQFYQATPDEEAFNHAVDMAVEAAVEAWNTRDYASLGTGKTELNGYSFCREGYMQNGDINTWPSKNNLKKLISEVDKSVNVVKVNDASGKLSCLIVNYANHPDSSSHNGYNADYPAYLRAALKDKYGHDLTVLYFNGAQGDVNYYDYINGTSGGRDNASIGGALAISVIKLTAKIDANDKYPTIAAVSSFYDAVQRHPSEENLEWGRRIMEKVNNGQSVGSLDKCFALEYTTADYSKLGETFKIEVQTIVLGDFAFAALPCEPFSEIALKIKEGSPFENTAVIGLANGCHGYIGPDFIQGTGSYPARFSMYNGKAGLGTADLLINKSIEQLNDMKRK